MIYNLVPQTETLYSFAAKTFFLSKTRHLGEVEESNGLLFVNLSIERAHPKHSQLLKLYSAVYSYLVLHDLML